MAIDRLRDALDHSARRLHGLGGIESQHVYHREEGSTRYRFENCPDADCRAARRALSVTPDRDETAPEAGIDPDDPARVDGDYDGQRVDREEAP